MTRSQEFRYSFFPCSPRWAYMYEHNDIPHVEKIPSKRSGKKIDQSFIIVHVILTLSQTNPGFYVSAVQVF